MTCCTNVQNFVLWHKLHCPTDHIASYLGTSTGITPYKKLYVAKQFLLVSFHPLCLIVSLMPTHSPKVIATCSTALATAKGKKSFRPLVEKRETLQQTSK